MSRQERLDRLLIAAFVVTILFAVWRARTDRLRLETLARWHVAPTCAAAIDLADPHSLGVVPGIGPSLVERLAHADAFLGSIGSPDDLLRIPGLGEDVADRVAPFVRNPRHAGTIDAPSSR